MKIKSVQILTAMDKKTKRFTLFLEKQFKENFALTGTEEQIMKFCKENNIKTFNGLNVEDFLNECLLKNKMYISF